MFETNSCNFFLLRILKPYIRQDYEAEPKKLKLLREISRRNNIHTKYPIDYLYLQPKHVPQVNRLAREFFWPGIDGEPGKNIPKFISRKNCFSDSSFRMLEISRFQLCCLLQRAHYWFCILGPWLQSYRSLLVLHFHTPRMEKSRHCKIHAVSLNSNLHGERYSLARFCHQHCLFIVPEVWFQNWRNHSKLLWELPTNRR